MRNPLTLKLLLVENMNTDRLFEVLSKMHLLALDFKEALERELKFSTFPKGHNLVQADTAAHGAFFLETGFALSFRYQGNKRVVTDFWQDGEIVLSPKSFFRQLPTDEIIQLAIDSELLSISHASAQKLFKEFPVANFLARDIAADYHARGEERIIDLHTLDAWPRYQKLLDSHPGIELKVSQDNIASYLNITPQSLSRMKAEHM